MSLGGACVTFVIDVCLLAIVGQWQPCSVGIQQVHDLRWLP